MAKVRLSSTLRSKAIKRAQKRCEYCQKPDDREFNISSHEIDHIIAQKHGGKTRLDNLAYACLPCNLHKSADYRSFDPHTGADIRLFNPRVQQVQRNPGITKTEKGDRERDRPTIFLLCLDHKSLSGVWLASLSLSLITA